jgi:hypothetical protein
MTNTAELWQRVVFREEEKLAGMTAILQSIVSAVREKGGRPDGAQIWHKPTGSGDHLYFFSPSISALISEALREAKAVPAALPNLKIGFNEVPLPVREVRG